MASRFNTLLLGSAEDAADILEAIGADYHGAPDTQEYMRLALTNALRRIAALERQLDRLHHTNTQADPT